MAATEYLNEHESYVLAVGATSRVCCTVCGLLPVVFESSLDAAPFAQSHRDHPPVDDDELTEADLDPAVIAETLQQYLVTALWCSTGEDGEPLDDDYSIDDLAPSALAQAREDVGSFLISNADLLTAAKDSQAGYDDAAAAHDFWLTRNGHGAGFWDRGLGQVGDDLTANVKPYGSCDLYVGDDGSVYLA